MTLDDKNILVTGGTGSFGKKFITKLLDDTKVKELFATHEMSLSNISYLNN